MAEIDDLLDNFAFRCFREVTDCDYICARMSYRAWLTMQYLWSSQQALEKYLKRILLLNRVEAVDVGHRLGVALRKLQHSSKVALGLTDVTLDFVEYLDAYGRFRYLEASPFTFGRDIIKLDRAVWERRRFCTRFTAPRQKELREGQPAPKVRLPGGYLEKVADDLKHPAREPLLWQNGFFGRRTRRRVRVYRGFSFTNSPLFLYPDLLGEVQKYVHVPKDIKDAYCAAGTGRRPRM